MAEFELLGGDEDETRLLRERATGYSVALPGHPSLAPLPSEGPRYDVVIKLGDVAVEMGFRLDRVKSTMDPQVLVKTFATTYAGERTASTPHVAPVPGRFRPNGVTGSAHATYPLATSNGGDATMEHLFVLARPASDGALSVVYQTSRFQTAAVDQIHWSHLRAAILDQHHWDPDHPRTSAPSLWPASSLALPSAALELTDEARRDASAKAAAVGPLEDNQTIALANLLREISLVDMSPRYELIPEQLVECARRVELCVPARASTALLANLSQCKTMHDLRAWAWQCAWAVANRTDRGPAQRPAN